MPFALVVCLLIACVYWKPISSQSVCPNGWTPYANSCYLFSDVKESKPRAAIFCESLGSTLVSIESRKEDEFLRNTLINDLHGHTSKIYYWTDGTDVAWEGTWYWGTSGLPITGYSNWYPGEPNNSKNQDCLTLDGDYHFNWDDDYCEGNHRAICELQLSASGILG